MQIVLFCTDPSGSKSKETPRNSSIFQSMLLLVSTNFFRGLNCGLQPPEGENVGGEGMAIVTELDF